MLPGTKKLDFGLPLAPSGVQNDAQNRKSGAQEALYAPVRAPPREGPGTDLSPRAFLERHFVDFCRDLVPKCLILGPPWRPAVSKMAPKIAQVAPKS